MHARSVIVDGRIGYTGGFGIDDKWISDRPDDPMWRETTVRFTGPAVEQMQATFLGAWAEATGDLLTGEEFFPASREDGEATATAGLLYSRPGLGPTTAERFLALTIASAERTLFISNSYFVPTPLMRELLVDAAVRGVDVRLLVPGERTDIPSTRWAGRGFYEELLTAGVRVFEYQPSMMHAKTLVADGAWVAVGSLNFDNRSIRLNDESALLVFDRQVGARMDSVFLQDLERAEEITLRGHARRSAIERMLELLTRLVAPLL
jgi:cardiolipin synthase